MFDALSDRLRDVLGKLSGRGRITEADVDAAMREIRLALLEADVNYKVVKDFVGRVKERAIGQDVLEGINAGQLIVKIVHDELTAILGARRPDLPPERLAGGHRAGRTPGLGQDHLGRQARPLHRAPGPRSRSWWPRTRTGPAAVDQLQTLGQALDIPVYSAPTGTAVGGHRARRHRGGRSAPAATWSSSTRPAASPSTRRSWPRSGASREVVQPDRDAAGRGCDGRPGGRAGRRGVPRRRRASPASILTKIDGDARGGAALSISAVTGVPVKFMGTGEKTDALEVFHPDRLAGRILGMGDVLTLVERAQETFDQKQAEQMAEKLKKNSFTLEDFLEQMQALKKMGPLGRLLEMIPGMGGAAKQAQQAVDRAS